MTVAADGINGHEATVADEGSSRGPRITVQLDRAHMEFLRAHRREYGVAASWIVRRLIDNQVASGRDLLGKPLKASKSRRIRRPAKPVRQPTQPTPAA